jgi:hypothetical protein
MEHLRHVPGFDQDAYDPGIGFTEDGRFCVWRRKEG